MNTATVSSTILAPHVQTDHTVRRQGSTTEITLRKGQLHTWNGNHIGHVIEAREGTLWLTQDGDSRDIILRPGQSFRLTRPGRTIAQSLSAAARVASL